MFARWFRRRERGKGHSRPARFRASADRGVGRRGLRRHRSVVLNVFYRLELNYIGNSPFYVIPVPY